MRLTLHITYFPLIFSVVGHYTFYSRAVVKNEKLVSGKYLNIACLFNCHTFANRI